MAFKNAKKRLMEELHKYVDKSVLPNSYVVYRRLLNDHRAVDYEEYLAMVRDEMKEPQGGMEL